MAYPKITVNTGMVRPVYASDTVLIPSPQQTLITGTATALKSGTANSNVSDHLVDTTANFLSTDIPLPITTSDIAINTAGGTQANITNVLATDLTLDADIFPNGNENYALTRSNHLIDTSETFVTKGVQVGDIVQNTTNTNTALPFMAYVTKVVNEKDIILSSNLFGTKDDFSSNYTIYQNPNGQYTGSVTQSSSEGCLLYVTSATAATTIATSFVTVKVLTVAGDIVTFANVPVGTYLPVQVRQLFTTGTDTDARNGVCLAIW